MDSRLACGSDTLQDPEELDSLVRQVSSEEDSLFCGGTPNGIQGLESLRTYEVVKPSMQALDAKGDPTLRQALPTMPFEQQDTSARDSFTF